MKELPELSEEEEVEEEEDRVTHWSKANIATGVHKVAPTWSKYRTEAINSFHLIIQNMAYNKCDRGDEEDDDGVDVFSPATERWPEEEAAYFSIWYRKLFFRIVYEFSEGDEDGGKVGTVSIIHKEVTRTTLTTKKLTAPFLQNINNESFGLEIGYRFFANAFFFGPGH
jgi:hypothetical protein